MSCLKFMRKSDICLLGWDMMDHTPNGYDLSWAVHGSIFAYGIGLLDNALLQPLAEACAEEGRYEFMITINPLRVVARHGLAGQPGGHTLGDRRLCIDGWQGQPQGLPLPHMSPSCRGVPRGSPNR